MLAEAGARKSFLGSGGLKALQLLDPGARRAVASHGSAALRELSRALLAAAGSAGLQPASALAAVAAGSGDEELGELIEELNRLYPADVVAYCRPEFGLQLLEQSSSQAKLEAAKSRAAASGSLQA